MSKAKCLMCNTILESKHRHDFVQCSCPNETFLDGGDEYWRLGGHCLDLIEMIDKEKKE